MAAKQVPHDVLLETVRRVLSRHPDGEVTARMVRHSVESMLDMPIDSLAERKEELLDCIGVACEELNKSGRPGGQRPRSGGRPGSSGSPVRARPSSGGRPDSGGHSRGRGGRGGRGGGGGGGRSDEVALGVGVPSAIEEARAALDDADSGAGRAALIVAELTDAPGRAPAAEAMLLLAEVCAQSVLASGRLLDAGIAGVLCGSIEPEKPKAMAGSALRLLSALSTHDSLTERLLRTGRLVEHLVTLLPVAGDEVAAQVANLMHNLADGPANRLRLLHGGVLIALTHVILTPSASAGVKEQCLHAAAACAGLSHTELSFPELLGRMCASKVPGTVRDALTSLEVIVEKQPEVRRRLGETEEVVEGLRVAAGSSDLSVASGAAALLDSF